jgi:IS1 family transposase
MNRLSTEERGKVIACLIEGCSIRSTVRMTGIAKKTVLRLLIEIGNACEDYHDRIMRGLNCKLIECDEIWSFVYAKERNVPDSLKGRGVGDVWTWVALDPVSKLIPSWHVGSRDAESAYWFIHDLKERLAHRIQLTTDGHKPYLEAVESAFGADIDYSMLIKLYGNDVPTEARYSPPVCIGARAKRISGKPNGTLISTSRVERQNLTMRMSMRRFTRLTNAFSKKFENHCASIALHFTHYNFARIHQSLRVTPAMEAGLCDHVWSVEEIAKLLD